MLPKAHYLVVLHRSECIHLPRTVEEDKPNLEISASKDNVKHTHIVISGRFSAHQQHYKIFIKKITCLIYMKYPDKVVPKMSNRVRKKKKKTPISS